MEASSSAGAGNAPSIVTIPTRMPAGSISSASASTNSRSVFVSLSEKSYMANTSAPPCLARIAATLRLISAKTSASSACRSSAIAPGSNGIGIRVSSTNASYTSTSHDPPWTSTARIAVSTESTLRVSQSITATFSPRDRNREALLVNRAAMRESA